MKKIIIPILVLISMIAICYGAACGSTNSSASCTVGANLLLSNPAQPFYMNASSPTEGAIKVTTSHVTINCNNSNITGNGTGYGIQIGYNVQDVTITNCNLTGYNYHLQVATSTNDFAIYNVTGSAYLATNLLTYSLNFSGGQSYSLVDYQSTTQMIQGDELDGLPAVGSNMSNFVINISRALLQLGIIIAVLAGVVGIFVGITALIKGMLKGQKGK